jgi:predicted Fe-Mo cluster-binding NifX family protein
VTVEREAQRARRVAVSADDSNGLESVVSPHFGRCPFYVLVDLDGLEVKQVGATENPYFGDHVPGAVPGFIRDQGVDVMLTGGMGRRAIGFFTQYGIEAVTGASGTVRRALEQYLGGGLQGAEPCRESIGHASGSEDIDSVGDHLEYEADEVGRLREEAKLLQEQLGQVMARLRDLTPGGRSSL